MAMMSIFYFAILSFFKLKMLSTTTLSFFLHLTTPSNLFLFHHFIHLSNSPTIIKITLLKEDKAMRAAFKIYLIHFVFDLFFNLFFFFLMFCSHLNIEDFFLFSPSDSKYIIHEIILLTLTVNSR